MNFENFTIKSREAVQKAVNLAADGGQQAVGTLHLLAGVLAVGENVTQFLFGKIGVNLQQLQEALQKRLQALPRVQGGGEPYLEREANEVLQQSQSVAKQMGDTFVGLEPLLMALLNVKSEASVLLKEQGVAEGMPSITTHYPSCGFALALLKFMVASTGCKLFIQCRAYDVFISLTSDTLGDNIDFKSCDQFADYSDILTSALKVFDIIYREANQASE